MNIMLLFEICEKYQNFVNVEKNWHNNNSNKYLFITLEYFNNTEMTQVFRLRKLYTFTI